jgi:hypothetical protein
VQDWMQWLALMNMNTDSEPSDSKTDNILDQLSEYQLFNEDYFMGLVSISSLDPSLPVRMSSLLLMRIFVIIIMQELFCPFCSFFKLAI